MAQVTGLLPTKAWAGGKTAHLRKPLNREVLLSLSAEVLGAMEARSRMHEHEAQGHQLDAGGAWMKRTLYGPPTCVPWTA